MFRSYMLCAAIAVLILGAAPSSHAEITSKKTIISQKEIPGAVRINFTQFDLNEDDVLSMSEVGTKLFYIFDTDGNEVIDNMEFIRKKILTILPMEKQTYISSDFNNDGLVDKEIYTYETFNAKSHLMRFDNNADGLSAADFIEEGFLDLDKDNSKVIELGEWKAVYIASLAERPSAVRKTYNN